MRSGGQRHRNKRTGESLHYLSGQPASRPASQQFVYSHVHQTRQSTHPLIYAFHPHASIHTHIIIHLKSLVHASIHPHAFIHAFIYVLSLLFLRPFVLHSSVHSFVRCVIRVRQSIDSSSKDMQVHPCTVPFSSPRPCPHPLDTRARIEEARPS